MSRSSDYECILKLYNKHTMMLSACFLQRSRARWPKMVGMESWLVDFVNTDFPRVRYQLLLKEMSVGIEPAQGEFKG
jgi:hypothetical protein